MASTPPDLEGFTGIGHSIEDCLYKTKWGMKEHVELLREQGLPVPENNPDPKIVIQKYPERPRPRCEGGAHENSPVSECLACGWFGRIVLWWR